MSAGDQPLLDPLEILESLKFPSQFAGQMLFMEGEDLHNTAMLGWMNFPWELYAAGYKDAADALVQALMSRHASLDSAVYPLVFLYRQGLELELKVMVRFARRLLGLQRKTDHGHALMPLWR